MTTLLLVICIAIFIGGSALDIMSSIGKRELNPVFAGKNQIYQHRKNIIFTAGIFAALIALYFYMNMPVLMLMFVVCGVPRALLAVRNFRLSLNF
ncbi:MAG: hypothetical protein MSG64_16765 [Pyrinomonadaceae bacterium MAG19_C2-C3]|nr:hypothetical protein [Pyrinomonadaceae bacterium MAG19_C2-C3]